MGGNMMPYYRFCSFDFWKVAKNKLDITSNDIPREKDSYRVSAAMDRKGQAHSQQLSPSSINQSINQAMSVSGAG